MRRRTDPEETSSGVGSMEAIQITLTLEELQALRDGATVRGLVRVNKQKHEVVITKSTFEEQTPEGLFEIATSGS